MPKEIIYGHPPHDPDAGHPAPFAPVVGWQPGMDMQVGITSIGDEHLFAKMMGHGNPPEVITENMVHLGRSAYIHLGTVGAINNPPLFGDADAEATFMFHLGCAISEHVQARHSDWKSLWWHPTRHEANRLIALLRKAGKATFGSDEW